MVEKPESGEFEELAQWLCERLDHVGEPIGEGYQASVDFFQSPFGDLVVKRPKGSRFLHAFRKRAIRREYRIYRRLRGVAGIPECLGMIDRQYLVLRHVPGKTLRDVAHALRDQDRLYVNLWDTIQAMHRAGVAHGDLKRKENILVDADEQPYVIDFGVAYLLNKNAGRLNRAIFDWIRQSDYNAWVKLKYQWRTDKRNLSLVDREIQKRMLLERVAAAVRVAWRRLTFRTLRKQRRAKPSRRV